MNNELTDIKTVTLQLQVEIEPNKLNGIQGLRFPYIQRFGKISQKEFLAKLLIMGFDGMHILLNDKEIGKLDEVNYE